MKRALVALLLVAALLVPAFGQDIGAPWIDSSKPFVSALDDTTGTPTFRVALPTSLLAFVSNGIYTDEIDLIIRNPLALSQYSGYTLWTLYGNYEYQNRASNFPVSTVDPAPPATQDIKPFFTTTLTDDSIGNFQAGIGMPVPFMSDWRMGLLGGNQFTKSNNLTGGYSTIDSTDPQTIDADGDNTVDATTSVVIKAKDETTTGSFRLAAGLDMGFLGVSLYAFMEDKTRITGGSYSGTWADGADDNVWANQPTSAQSLYGVGAFGTDAQGTGALGEAKAWANGSRSLFGAIGQLPLELFGMSTPITARLGFDTYSGLYPTDMPARYTITTGYVVNNDAAKVTTQSWTGSQAVDVPWSPSAPVAYVAEPTTEKDPLNSGFGYFATSIGAWIDPIIKTDGPLILKTRAGLNYTLGLEDKKTLNKAYSYTSRATTAASNDIWTYSKTGDYKSFTSRSVLTFDIGALGEFRNAEDTIGLGLGLYAKPLIKLAGTSKQPQVTTTTRSWTDQNTTTEVTLLAAQGQATLAAAAGLIGDGEYEGTSILTTMSTFADSDIDNEFGITMTLPVSARISFFDKKLTLVGGYAIEFANSVTYKHTASYTNTESLVIRDSAGTEVFNSSNRDHYPATPGAASNPTASTAYWDTATNQTWKGSMGFMLRWVPSDNITVDVSGTSVKAAIGALDPLLSLNNGLTLSALTDFIDALSMSVTFHF